MNIATRKSPTNGPPSAPETLNKVTNRDDDSLARAVVITAAKPEIRTENNSPVTLKLVRLV